MKKSKKIVYLLIVLVIIILIVLGIYFLLKLKPFQVNKIDFTITTDKTEYGGKDRVRVTLVNNLEVSAKPLAILEDRDNLKREQFGDDYGSGFFEKFEVGEWVKVEPLWRCGGCLEVCFYNPTMKPGERRVLEWDRMVESCISMGEKKETKKIAEIGRYRIVSDIQIEGQAEPYRVYSNEFRIVDDSAKEVPQKK